MYVRCTHCGYDNSPEYRFCGMCGASLAHPPVATKPATKEVSGNVTESPAGNGHNGSETVHGPSFLGLAEDPKTEFHYLYEDEPPRSYAGLIFILVLLIAVGGFGYWQWRHNGFPFNRLSALNHPPSQTASPSEVAPAQSQEQQTNIPKPMTGAADTSAPGDQSAKTPDTGKTTDFSAQGGQNTGPSETPTKSATQPSPAPEEKAPEAPEKTEEAKATPPAHTTKAAKSHSRPITEAISKSAAPVATTAAPASPDADLEQTGERYLYGTGLPQNCARAESALSTAATHGNSKAQTVLGTMYATGHCVGRDLPTAYRWFARALHQEPQNARISEDLQVLWRQMTPQEKQLATASGQ